MKNDFNAHFRQDNTLPVQLYVEDKIVDSRPVYSNPSYVPGKRSRNHPYKRQITLRCLGEEYKKLWSCEEDG